MLLALRVGQHHAPERFEHGEALFMRHRLLDRAGEAHRVGRFGLDLLGLGAQGLCRVVAQAVAGAQERVDALFSTVS